MDIPRLVFLSGPLQGKSQTLREGEMSVGRDATNTVVLNHSSVSRRHCSIRTTDAGVVIGDLDSKNGTFVNGLPVRNTVLQHGSEIRIGNSHILFLCKQEEEPGEFLHDDPVAGGSTVVLEEADLLYSNLGSSVVLERGASKRLAQLLVLARQVAELHSESRLAPTLFSALQESLPAQRAALVLGEDPAEPGACWFWTREAGMVPALRLSRTLLRQALVERKFVLQNGFLPESAPSLAADQVCSIVCVPLVRPNGVLGALYMDTSDLRESFTEEHLQFASAAAGIAALALENLRLWELMREENRSLRREMSGSGHIMVGESAALQQVLAFVRKAAKADSTVLVLGESGVGKELVARSIHNGGDRAEGSFIAVNCAAFTESLLESDLFGHEKGAFTGAIQQRKGKFERADGGTLFLDEVADLAPAVQAKLLRVLQEREFERVGGSRPVHVNVRLIAATNRDLKEEVRKGSFREDLYYRLNVLTVRVPSLKERIEDIPLLAAHFLARSSRRLHRPVPELSDRARSCLLQYSWPGNVRELENVIERAVVLSESEAIEPEDLPEALSDSYSDPRIRLARFQEAIKETKSRVILEAVKQAKGNLTEAARSLGVNANYLHRLIRNLNLRTSIEKEK